MSRMKETSDDMIAPKVNHVGPMLAVETVS